MLSIQPLLLQPVEEFAEKALAAAFASCSDGNEK
jgi:hypothetical protein